MFEYPERLYAKYSIGHKGGTSADSFERWIAAWKRRRKISLIILFAAFAVSSIALVICILR